jgi:hypothetical protein
VKRNLFASTLVLSLLLLLSACAFGQAPTGTVTIWTYQAGGSGNNIQTLNCNVQADGTCTVELDGSTLLSQNLQNGLPVFAVYNGDAGHSGSVSPEVDVTITSGIVGTQTTLTITPNPTTQGTGQTFTIVVSNAAGSPSSGSTSSGTASASPATAQASSGSTSAKTPKQQNK